MGTACSINLKKSELSSKTQDSLNTMICIAFVFLAFLLHPAIEGSPLPSKGRCICIGSGANFISPAHIKTMEIFPSSAICPQLEIIVTLKDKTKKCLNPKSKFTLKFMKNAKKSR
uniref:C-X-C motif chemokine n=1 Tax=Erpetoichthys calabaricus TaxID=27687 RepID=A0A8C4SKZ2_ERPCA